jgi:hypothetical protein
MILSKKLKNSKSAAIKQQKEKQDILTSILDVSNENKNLSEEMRKNYIKKLHEMYNLFSERIY